jgi:hypothetical protein
MRTHKSSSLFTDPLRAPGAAAAVVAQSKSLLIANACMCSGKRFLGLLVASASEAWPHYWGTLRLGRASPSGAAIDMDILHGRTGPSLDIRKAGLRPRQPQDGA